MRGSLTEGIGSLRAPRRLERVVRRALGKARLRVLVREPIGLARGDLREPRLNDLGNASVQLLAPAPEERLVGRLVHKGVPERIGHHRRHPAAMDQLARHELIERDAQRIGAQGRDGGKHFVRELPTDTRRELRHRLRRRS